MYNIIIFDLDDTLTNDKENIKEAFKEVIKFKNEKYTDIEFERFYKIDKETWRKRAAGELSTPYEDNNEKKAEWLRVYRFLKYYNNEITYNEAVKLNNLYMEGMKRKIVSRPYTFETVRYIYNKGYKIVIATNGPIVPLNEKMNKLGITQYISNVFSAEEVGAMKPHEDFYKGLFKKIDVKPNDKMLFIGDELEKDIKGAIENKIDTCWCNYNNEKNTKYKINYEIHNLKELTSIL